MPEQLPIYRVRKGDVVAICVHDSVTSINTGMTRSDYWVVGEVTKATRGGWAAEVSWDTKWGWATTSKVPVPGRRCSYTQVLQTAAVPRDKIADRAGLLAAVAGHKFDDIDTAREAVRPYITLPAKAR